MNFKPTAHEKTNICVSQYALYPLPSLRHRNMITSILARWINRLRCLHFKTTGWGFPSVPLLIEKPTTTIEVRDLIHTENCFSCEQTIQVSRNQC